MINATFKLTILLLMLFTEMSSQINPKVSVNQLQELPAIKDEGAMGYAGMVGGIHNGVLIVAGGANFPEGPPWEGGQKVYSKSIYILENGEWRESEKKLPSPLAYASSVQTGMGILIIGGEWGKVSTEIVLLLKYDPETKDIQLIEYPSLPEPLSYTAAVRDGEQIYLVGGKNSERSTNAFYRFDISSKKWDKLPDFPGEPRVLHSAVIQEGSLSKLLIVVGGRNQEEGKKSVPLSDYLTYNIKSNTWQQMGPVRINDQERVIMGASAHAVGSMHVLIYGGSNEILFNKLEQLALDQVSFENDSILSGLKHRQYELLKDHPGFSRDILAYNTITDRWFIYDSIERPIPITALDFEMEEDLVIVSGEIAPGVRSPELLKLTIAEAVYPFGYLNYTVLALYLLISLLIGFYFSKKQKSTNDYFIGGGRVPWWASGLSVFGTLLSAITFMAIPAKAFITDWSYFFLNITAILITPLIAYLFIPYFNKLKISTAYEYLEDRFNYSARAFGSFSFILFQLGRIGIVLLLPSLAISIVTGISVETCILSMGILCVLYTTFGGIEAVIWTDVLQVIVLLGGSVLAVIWIIFHSEASFTEMISYAADKEKFNIADMSFDFTESTFWVVFIGGLASAMVTQGTDQTIVQRYLTSNSVRDSRKTIFTNAVLTLPATIIFFGIGTLLFIYYSEMPERLSPAISNNDSIFPWYIVKELPAGVSGLLVAGIFSAAMSSISSSLNSVSTAFCNDFYRRFRPQVLDKRLLKIARIATVLTGLLGVMLALWMASSNIKSLWDQFYKFLGLFTGGLGGMFLLGMLTKKANAIGTLSGLFISALLVWYISVFTEISFLMYSFFGVVSCFVLGYLFSLLIEMKNS